MPQKLGNLQRFAAGRRWTLRKAHLRFSPMGIDVWKQPRQLSKTTFFCVTTRRGRSALPAVGETVFREGACPHAPTAGRGVLDAPLRGQTHSIRRIRERGVQDERSQVHGNRTRHFGLVRAAQLAASGETACRDAAPNGRDARRCGRIAQVQRDARVAVPLYAARP